MNRRKLLASTGTLAAATLAGCSGIFSDDETDPSTETGTDTETTPTNTSTQTETPEPTDTETPEDTPTPTEVPIQNSKEELMANIYTAWATSDENMFLAECHSTNDYPEDDFRGSTPDFNGELTTFTMEVLETGLSAETLGNWFEAAKFLGDDDVSTFTDVETARVRVTPTIEGETENEREENYKNYINSEKTHIIAVEDNHWQFVL
jgi:hypothetical protein